MDFLQITILNIHADVKTIDIYKPQKKNQMISKLIELTSMIFKWAVTSVKSKQSLELR